MVHVPIVIAIGKYYGLPINKWIVGGFEFALAAYLGKHHTASYVAWLELPLANSAKDLKHQSWILALACSLSQECSYILPIKEYM